MVKIDNGIMIGYIIGTGAKFGQHNQKVEGKTMSASTKKFSNFDLRARAASDILYDWACGKTETHKAKILCEKLGFQIDFRQPDRGDWMEVYDTENNQPMDLIF